MTRLRLPAWRSLAWAGLAVAAMFAAPAARAEWAPFAYVSATMGVSDSRICIGEASRGEIGCPSYAPTVSATGTLNVTGGLVTNAVSLTTAGTTWGYLNSNASYLPNLSSNAISTTSLTVNGVSVTGAGASKLASLTDVSASSPIYGAVLQYDGTKWNAVSTSALISGSQVAFSVTKGGTNQTVSANTDTDLTWSTKEYDTSNAFNTATGSFTPKVAGKYLFTASIYCQNDTSYCSLRLKKNGSFVYVNYQYVNNTDVALTALVDMNGTTDTVKLSVATNDGTVVNGGRGFFQGALINAVGSGSAGGATALSGLSDVTLSGLTTGQVLTYNGSSWVNSAGVSGDRLTSGTLAVTANSATSVVSLTTGGTTWGYFGSAASYLPSLTAAQVSATAISTTAVQIASVTTVTACSATNAGTLRYNSASTALELCTGSGWQPMGVGIPAGTISAFASTTCPTGWSEYTPARGRFLRGIDNGAGNDPDGTRSPGATQADAFQGHRQHIGVNYVTGGSNIRVQEQNATSSFSDNNVALPANLQTLDFITDGTNGTPRISNETRPKNVAVTYCQFNGTSNGWNNPLSGGSTVAAGSTGQIQYNTGNSFDANAGLTWTNASQRLTATNISATALTVNGVAITGSASGDRITSGTTSLIANTSGTLEANAPLNVSGTVNATGVSTTGPVSTSAVHFQDNPSEACTTGNIGAMKVISGRVYTCRL